MTSYLVDTGPIVAFLNRRDRYHKWTVDQLAAVSPPLYTCEAVLSEAFFLLRRDRAGVEGLVKLLERQIVRASFQLDEHLQRVGKLLHRYSDVRISLADACLVRMSELQTDSRLLTFDDDFNVYRRNGRQVIPTVSPNG